MNFKRTLAAAAAVAIAAVSFAGCGDSSSASGTVTNATSANAVTEAPAATDAPAETNAPAETDAPATTDAPAGKTYEHIFKADMAKIKYNGAEIAVGDNINDVKASLGDEAAPSTDAPSCLTGNTIKEYYYKGMTIQANTSGVIFSISLCNDPYEGGDGSTVGGVKLGDDEAAVKDVLGEPDETKKTNLIYKDGTLSLQVTVAKKGTNVIWVSDSSKES